MSKSNKSAREMLEKIYGKGCMIHEGIRSLNPPKPLKGKFKGKSIAYQLTYHHLKPKHLGGQATVENGANLCRTCHTWLEQLSQKEREKINDELRAYKRNFFKIGAIELTTEGIQQAEVFEAEQISEQLEVIEIPAYDFSEEEYKKYLQERRKRELAKPKWRGER